MSCNINHVVNSLRANRQEIQVINRKKNFDLTQIPLLKVSTYRVQIDLHTDLHTSLRTCDPRVGRGPRHLVLDTPIST